MEKQPLLIIGLDGATFDLLRPFVEAERLPNIARLMAQGQSAELLSTWPPLTLPAWTSFMTGVDPSVHGITDLVMRWPHPEHLRPASAHGRALPTFLSSLSQRGLRVAALGVPGTYPPEEINGIHISGFDAPGADRAHKDAVWPQEYWSELQAKGGWRYATFNEHRGGQEQLNHALQCMLEDISAKENIILSTFNKEKWDVFFVHLQASDTAAHHFWHTYDKKSPRYLGDAYQHLLPMVYSRLDALIGKILSAADDDLQVLLVSDHGMGGASNQRVHLNRFLAEHGFLKFKNSLSSTVRQTSGSVLRGLLGRLPRESMGILRRALPDRFFSTALGVLRGQDVDRENTCAFSDEFDYSPSIWLHSKDRFSKGTVEPEAKEELLEQLEALCLKLKDKDGRALIQKTYRPKDVYRGEYINRLPDLILEPAWLDGYRVSFLPSSGEGPWHTESKAKDWCAPKGYGMPGVHRREGVLILYGNKESIVLPESLPIEEAGRMVYDLLKEPRPSFCKPESDDGRGGSASTSAGEEELLEYESQPVEERLRALGYL